MFYIIGVAHSAQSKQKGKANSAAQTQLWNCISDITVRVKPALIAEELNQETLDRLSKAHGGIEESIAKEVARRNGVGHRFCDPDGKERARIGYVERGVLALQIPVDNEGFPNKADNIRIFAIEVAQYWPLREQYWLDNLGDVLDKDVVFVCGESHVESFGKLLEEKSINSSVIARRIGVSQCDDVWWDKVRSYLESHPELRV